MAFCLIGGGLSWSRRGSSLQLMWPLLADSPLPLLSGKRQSICKICKHPHPHLAGGNSHPSEKPCCAALSEGTPCSGLGGPQGPGCFRLLCSIRAPSLAMLPLPSESSPPLPVSARLWPLRTEAAEPPYACYFSVCCPQCSAIFLKTVTNPQ